MVRYGKRKGVGESEAEQSARSELQSSSEAARDRIGLLTNNGEGKKGGRRENVAEAERGLRGNHLSWRRGDEGGPVSQHELAGGERASSKRVTKYIWITGHSRKLAPRNRQPYHQTRAALTKRGVKTSTTRLGFARKKHSKGMWISRSDDRVIGPNQARGADDRKEVLRWGGKNALPEEGLEPNIVVHRTFQKILEETVRITNRGA